MEPAATITEAGTVVDASLLASVTVAPPVGAAALKVTVPVALVKLATLAGFTEMAERVTPLAGVIVRVAVLLTLL